MTDYKQEQEDELESLEALYPSTFKRDKDEPSKKFSIEILPHQDSDEPNHVGIKLFISYPLKYPDEIIKDYKIEIIKGLKDKQIKELEKLMNEISEDNIGAPMMFTICTELQEWLIQNNIPCDTSLHDQMKAQNELKQRLQRLTFGDENKIDDHTQGDAHCTLTEFDKSYKRSKGTPVNKKTFNKWSKEFLINYRMIQKEKYIKLYGNDDKRDKLTGVQIFKQKEKEKLSLIDNNNNSNHKTIVVGKSNNTKNNDNKNNVVISDESLFLDMDMPDM